jgi:hypothetical protein
MRAEGEARAGGCGCGPEIPPFDAMLMVATGPLGVTRGHGSAHAGRG